MPTHLPLTIIRRGQEEQIRLPVRDHPILLSFPRFALPSHLRGQHTNGVSVIGVGLYNFGRPIAQVLAQFGAEDYRVTENSRPVAFARLIAKIAWGIAVLAGRHATLDRHLRDALLYEPNQIGRWVGTQPGPPESAQRNILHDIEVREDRDTGWLLADVQLFAAFRTPRYLVLLGRL
jgi:hypothetical protein